MHSQSLPSFTPKLQKSSSPLTTSFNSTPVLLIHSQTLIHFVIHRLIKIQ